MSPPALLVLLTELSDAARRRVGLGVLGEWLGVDAIYLFGKDPLLGRFLPAPGTPQVLRNGRFWHAFADACSAEPGTVIERTLEGVCIEGLADITSRCVLAVEGRLSTDDAEWLPTLIESLACKLADERALEGILSDLHATRQLALRADALNKTLEVNRQLLLEAYQRAETELAQRRRAEANLTREIEVSQTIMHYSLDVIGLFDGNGITLQISNSVSHVWGYDPDEVAGHVILDFVDPEDREATRRAMTELASGAPLINYENRYRCKHGGIVHMLWNATHFGSEGHIIGIGRDISAIKLTTMRLEESEERLRSLFEHHADAVFARDLNGHFIEGNQALEHLTQYSRAELEQLQRRSLVVPEERARNWEYLAMALKGRPQSFRSSLQRKDGVVIEVDIAYIPTLVKGRVVGVYGIVRDVTEAANYQRHIAYLASHDELTGLPNRSLLNDRLRHAIEQRGAQQFAVLFMDLNRFKMVNDSLGHDKGDLLLKMTAERLRSVVREGDTVARLGGDEFVVVLERVDAFDHVAKVADTLLRAVAQPFCLDGHELTVSTSIGCSVYPRDGRDPATLLKHADLAMYQAKELQSGSFRFFDPAMNVTMLDRLLTESGIKRAIERDELVLHYQPRIDALTGTIIGIEALVRWKHPERGLIAPEDFIPMAEELGIIGAVGEWVLYTACRQNRAWQDAGLAPVRISVNISAHQISESGFADLLVRVLNETGLDASCLELEITETSLMQNIEASVSNLQVVKRTGVSISIDDFGTGYSSLAYLKKLPIDTLKIDKSFIQDLLTDPDDAAIVSATIALAHNMDLKVVAEGVTTAAQTEFLLQRNCTAMQGYLFSHPLPADDLTPVLQQNNERPDPLVRECAAR
ncbi:MAG: EAL domain-containing protein [Thiobacillus sp.]|nr:EAL domain-containing protein [Thiobacillus sp.]